MRIFFPFESRVALNLLKCFLWVSYFPSSFMTHCLQLKLQLTAPFLSLSSGSRSILAVRFLEDSLIVATNRSLERVMIFPTSQTTSLLNVSMSEATIYTTNQCNFGDVFERR
uniref:Uncharacterized protein n=1 Tax=Spongospora subterranea TaxID=70186 RepID=A0A0H5R530_9EUKA|eukprot:CRZ03227.1 hypothetical protein [Spongospora subterranea]